MTAGQIFEWLLLLAVAGAIAAWMLNKWGPM